MERAVLAIQRDPAYVSEVWQLSAEDLAGANPGQVEIRVAPVSDDDLLLVINAVATYPFRSKFAVKARKRKPIFAVDIAVPRDIEAGVGELKDVYLYSIDDLDKVILEGQGNREAAAVEASRLLDEEIRRYASIERSKEVVPVIAAIRRSRSSSSRTRMFAYSVPKGPGPIGTGATPSLPTPTV